MRRCISSLLFVGMMLGQFAAIPHGHHFASAADLEQHHAIPHVHLSSPSHSHGQPHSHHHPTTKRLERQYIASIAICCVPDSHHSDAIILPTWQRSGSSAEKFDPNFAFKSSGDESLARIHPARLTSPTPSQLDRELAGERLVTSALYLKLRALRI